jgi:hypothetical protein
MFSLSFLCTDQVNVATQELQSRTLASRGILEKLWDLEDAAMLTHEEMVEEEAEEYEDQDQDQDQDQDDENDENDDQEEKKIGNSSNSSSGRRVMKKRRQRAPKVRPIKDDRSHVELHNDLVHAVEVVFQNLHDELLRTAPTSLLQDVGSTSSSSSSSFSSSSSSLMATTNVHAKDVIKVVYTSDAMCYFHITSILTFG